MKVRRATLVLGLCASSVAVAGASVAWACTPSAHVAVTPGAGAPGSQVTVKVSSFHRDRPVQIRWDTAAGDVLNTAPASVTGSSSVGITVPDVPGGVYYIVGVQVDDQGLVIGEQSASFEVSAPARSTGTTGSGTSAGQPPATVADPAPVSAPPASSPTPASPAAPVPAAAPQEGAAPSAATGLGATAASSAPATASPTRGATAPRVAAATAAGTGPAASAAVAAVDPVATADSAPPPATAPVAAPSPRSAIAGLWSGFSDGTSGSVRGPSLAAAPAGSRNDGGLVLGVALLSLGSLALASLFGLAAVRRRRAPATTR